MKDFATSSDPAVQATMVQYAQSGADNASLTPALVSDLPAVLRDAVTSAYADALTPIFALMVPLFLLTSVVALFFRNVPLSRETGLAQMAEEEAEAILAEADGATPTGAGHPVVLSPDVAGSSPLPDDAASARGETTSSVSVSRP